MGYIDWAPCRCCTYWARNPYLWDDGTALCAWCWDFVYPDNYESHGGGVERSPAHWWSNYQCERANAVAALDGNGLLPSALRDVGILADLIIEFIFPLVPVTTSENIPCSEQTIFSEDDMLNSLWIDERFLNWNI